MPIRLAVLLNFALIRTRGDHRFVKGFDDGKDLTSFFVGALDADIPRASGRRLAEQSYIAAQIKKYYDTGRIEGVQFHTSKNIYLFDSRKLKEWKIAEYALPKGSVIEDTMAAKLSKYSHYIELLVLGILLLVLLLWLLFSNRKRKSTRGEKHETH